MRTVLLANRRLGVAIGRYLRGRGELCGVVVHPPASADCAGELAALGVPAWEWPAGRPEVEALAPDCLFSVLFGYQLRPEWLRIPSWRPINLHPGLLPYNRRRNPYVWPLVDGTPAGTTLHVMDENLDTGPLLCQQPVPVYSEDTALSLFLRLEAASLTMVTANWPGIRDVEPRPQVGPSTEHRLSDLAELDLGPDDLRVVDLIRARTFPPYGAEFVRDGVRYRARIEIERIG
jgi:methionyl-tRNA formyltransferase